jgi:EmrB/QacA subfamily drug resistance transporter
MTRLTAYDLPEQLRVNDFRSTPEHFGSSRTMRHQSREGSVMNSKPSTHVPQIRPDSDGSNGVPHRWVALVVLSLAQLMDIVDNTVMNIALPSAQADLEFSATDRQWVVTGYALAFGSLLLLGGRLSDYFGRKRMFLIGVGGFAVASAVGGAAESFPLLLVARIAQGGFGAMLAPAALSLLSVTFADNAAERGRAFGIFGAISGAGGALGLLLGGILTETLSWRWCLYVNVGIAAVAFVGALMFLRNGDRLERVRPDVIGAVTATAGLIGIVYGLGNAEKHGWNSIATVGPALGGIVLLIAFVLVELRVPHPLLPMHVVLDRVRGTAYLTIAIGGTGMFGVFLFLAYYLQNTLGLSPIQAGAAFLPMIGMVMVGAVSSGTLLMPRTGPRPLVPVGFALSAIGMATLTGISAESNYAASVLPALLVTGLGFGFVFGAVQNAATSGVESGDAGVASAMVNTAQQIGGSVGLAVFSSVFTIAVGDYLAARPATAALPSTITNATVASYHLVFWIACVAFSASAILAGLMFRSGSLPVGQE